LYDSTTADAGPPARQHARHQRAGQTPTPENTNNTQQATMSDEATEQEQPNNDGDAIMDESDVSSKEKSVLVLP